MQLSRFHVATDAVGVNGDRVRVVFATRTAEVRWLTDAVWESVRRGQLDELPDDLVEELIDVELLVPDGEDELQTVLDRNAAEVADNDDLYIVVQPTAACQLGCDYCGQQHTSRRLKPSDQDRLVTRVEQTLAGRRFRTLSTCWFGAEPLAGLPVMRAVTPRLIAAAEHAGCSYRSKLVTNGLALDARRAEEVVVQHRVGFVEITLDGTAEFHDARRHKKTGAPTFDRIFENLLALVRRDDLDVEVRLRCNVDRRNRDGVSPLLRRLAEAGVQRELSVYVAPVHSWGNDAHKLSLEKEEFARWEIGWLTEMLDLGFDPMLIPRRKPIVCLAVQPDAFLVDAYGAVFNCTEVSYVPSYGTPNEYELGHLGDDDDPSVRARLGTFGDRIADSELPCASCRMLPVCGGSCPKQWLEELNPCPPTKLNIEDRLLLALAGTVQTS